MLLMSITRDITLTKEDLKKIQASKQKKFLLDIVKKNKDKQNNLPLQV